MPPKVEPLANSLDDRLRDLKRQTCVPHNPSAAIAVAIVIGSGIVAFLGGLLTLCGWLFQKRRLVDWHDDGVAMLVNASLCVAACGLAICLLTAKKSPGCRRSGGAIGVFVALVGFLTLAEHLFGINLGIDTLILNRDWGQALTTSPMRMGVPASLSIAIFGVSIALTGMSKRFHKAASTLAIVPISICFLSIIGYWFGANSLYGVPAVTAIARQTSELLIAIGIGIIALIPEHGIHEVLVRRDAGGAVLRRLIVPIIVIPISLGWLESVGVSQGLFDGVFGTALQTIVAVFILVCLLVSTSKSISRQAQTIQDVKEKLASIVQSSEDAILSHDLDGTIQSWNQGATRLYGYTAEEVIGKNIAMLTLSHGENEDAQIALRLLNGERVESFETTRRSKNGKIIDVSITASLIRDSSGGISSVSKIARDITQRKRFDDAMRNREADLQLLANTIPQMAWMAEANGEVVWSNQRWFEYTGKTQERTRVEGWQSTIDPKSTNHLEVGWNHSLATGDPFESVLPILGRDQFYRPFLTLVRPLKDRQGNVLRWFGTHTDISDIKRSEQELLEARSRLDSILSAGEVGTWEFDVVTNTVFADHNLSRIFGHHVLGVQGRKLDEFSRDVHPDDRDQVKTLIESALIQGERFEAEFRIVRSDASQRWVVARGRVDRDSDGRAIRMPGVLLDVTQRKEVEMKLQLLAHQSDKLRRLYDTVLSNTPDLLYSFDLEGRLTFANKSLLSLWEKNSSEVIGKTFGELEYPPELANRLERQIREVIETGEPIRDETLYASNAGERYYDYILVPIAGEDGLVEAVAGSTRDITERKNVEDMVAESNRNKDQFLATLAHELRNPLSPIASTIALMRDGYVDSKDSRELIELADRHVKQLVRLLDDLLDVARINCGKIVLQKGLCCVQDSVKQAIESVQGMVGEFGHELTLELPENAIFVLGDPARLTQVFANLLSNAVKYTPTSGKLSISVRSDEQHAIFEASDTGIGIPKEGLHSIFQLFTQLTPTEDSFKTGLGIGLALVKQLVELHEGTVAIRSEGVGKGTVAQVRLPIRHPDTQTARSELGHADAESHHAEPPQASFRIMVVDDLRANTLTLHRLLERLGHTVCVANDGESALAKLADFQPDVVISDVSMPGMNGYELANRIRESIGNSIVLVAMTGHGTQNDRIKSSASGFNFHMVKPPDIEVLKQFFASLKS